MLTLIVTWPPIPLATLNSTEVCNERLVEYHQKILNNLKFVYTNNVDKLQNLAKYLLEKNPRIFLLGEGANLILIQTLANYLNKLNFHVVYSLDLDVQVKFWPHIHDNDCVFLFSYSGMTPVWSHLIEKLSTKPYLVAITSNLESSFYQRANLVLMTRSNEEVLLHQRNNYFSFLYLIMQLINLLIK